MATLYFSNQSSFLLFGLGLILTSLVLCQSHPLTDALTHTAPKTHVCALRRFFPLLSDVNPIFLNAEAHIRQVLDVLHFESLDVRAKCTCATSYQLEKKKSCLQSFPIPNLHFLSSLMRYEKDQDRPPRTTSLSLKRPSQVTLSAILLSRRFEYRSEERSRKTALRNGKGVEKQYKKTVYLIEKINKLQVYMNHLMDHHHH